MSVRIATTLDIPQMHELRLAVRENRLSDPLKVQPADYQRFLAGSGLGWVFEHEGQIVAFAIADTNERSIWALFVRPGFEGRGCGRALHDTMTNALFAIDHRPLWLCTEPHTRAEKFYRAAGWCEVGRESSGEIRFEKTATMLTHQLAQLNIAHMKEPLESPTMSGFVANLDRINALAESAPGFVWRLQDETGSALNLRPFGENHIVNMSVWDSLASLSAYAFQSDHAEIMRRRREWFEPMSEAHAVLWWVETGHHPSLSEAKERLDHLRQHGASPLAFTFKSAFPAPIARLKNTKEVR